MARSASLYGCLVVVGTQPDELNLPFGAGLVQGLLGPGGDRLPFLPLAQFPSYRVGVGAVVADGLDALAGKDVEAGVSPTVEHADELRGDLLLSQEHGEHLDAEELLEGLLVQFWRDPEQAFPVKTPIRGQDMQVGVKALRVISKRLRGNHRSGDRIRFRHRGLQKALQALPVLSG